MKQTIEIEVPDGKKAVWNNGKIEFIDVDVMESLKNSKNPEKDLMDIIAIKVSAGDYYLGSLYTQYMDTPDNSYLKSVARLKLFLAYLNGDRKFNLISGDIYYPYVRFYLNGKLPENKKAIGHFRYEGNTYTLIGNLAASGSHGLADFYSFNGVGNSFSCCGFLACKDFETAQFVATTFGKLLFDVNFGSLIKYEWLD